MATHDSYHNTKTILAIAPAAHTANVTGLDVDTSGYEAVLFTLDAGVITDGTHTPSLQEADDNGSGAPGAYTNVAAGSVLGAFTAMTTGAGNGGTAVQKVGCVSAKRWVRVFVTVASATTGGVYGAVASLSRPHNDPAI